MSINIFEIHKTQICTLKPQGAFNVEMSHQYLDLVRELPASVSRIWIDMADVTTMDASLFSTLLILHQEPSISGGIHVINCSRQIARALSISGVDRLISVHMAEKPEMDRKAGTYRLRCSDTR